MEKVMLNEAQKARIKQLVKECDGIPHEGIRNLVRGEGHAAQFEGIMAQWYRDFAGKNGEEEMISFVECVAKVVKWHMIEEVAEVMVTRGAELLGREVRDE